MKNRRDFIKISALGIGGAALGLTPLQYLRSEPEIDPTPDGGKSKITNRYPTYCEVCFWKCAAWVYTDQNDEIVKIIGNEKDPHCDGRLCPRGTGGIGMYTDEDRLKTPLIRVEKDGKQTYREASWEEATELIAKKMKETAAKHGPESIALFNHGSAGKHFGNLLKAFGSSNITAPSYAQCRGPREVGFAATFGSSIGSPEPTDIRNTRCLVLIGSHLGENMHNGQVQEMSDAIDNGATIITVDPRFSTVAGKSKFWLPIKPSTDMALLLAWMHVIIYEKRYDQNFISKHTIGFEQLKAHVKSFTPEWAYGITTIKPEQIRETARQMADAAPSVIVHPGRHVTWYGDDSQRARAVAMLNGLLGSWGQRGGFYMKTAAKAPSFPHPPYPKPKWSWKDILDGKYPLAGLAVSNSFIDASIPNKDNKHQIKAWIVAGTNLPITIPDKKKFLNAADALDFMVVVDTMPMEITGFADVVLPECTYLERFDNLRTSPHREQYIGLRAPAAKPKYNSKPAWWIAKQIGEKLGLADYFKYDDFEEVLQWQVKKMGLSYDELKKEGVLKIKDNPKLYFKNDSDHIYKTPSGKIEFYSQELKDKGFDPMPVYTAHEEPPQNHYRLIYGRAPMHTFSRTANNLNLVDLMPENNVWVNPKVAKIWNLKPGQEVFLKNQDGHVSSFPIKVRITERIRWDSIYMVHGFGHTKEQLKNAYGRGANTTELISNVKIDPLMGGTGMRGNFVTFITDKKEVKS